MSLSLARPMYHVERGAPVGDGRNCRRVENAIQIFLPDLASRGRPGLIIGPGHSAGPMPGADPRDLPQEGPFRGGPPKAPRRASPGSRGESRWRASRRADLPPTEPSEIDNRTRLPIGRYGVPAEHQASPRSCNQIWLQSRAHPGFGR
jgi:hypothetical protein